MGYDKGNLKPDKTFDKDMGFATQKEGGRLCPKISLNKNTQNQIQNAFFQLPLDIYMQLHSFFFILNKI